MTYAVLETSQKILRHSVSDIYIIYSDNNILLSTTKMVCKYIKVLQMEHLK